jgi:hypothetical protein
LGLLDLELLHNFCAATCYTIHSDPIQQTIWRINVPQIGFSFDFVMRSILALSGLHLAYLHPKKKDFYRSQALAHHQISLHTATKILPHVTQENCSALCIFSSLTSLFALASPRKPEDFLFVEKTGIAPWLVMFRGTSSIINSSRATLYSGPLGPMFQRGIRRLQLRKAPSKEDSAEEQRLKELHRLITQTTTDRERLHVYAQAIEELRRSFMVLTQGHDKVVCTDVLIWVFRVSEEYLLLLREQTQESLCIFAFFCVLLHQLHTVWWGEGWSSHLMNQICLLLNEEHRSWIWWPVEQVGWIATQPGWT